MLDPAIKSNTIAIDFDGVLHRYEKGWKGVEPTEGPTKGAREFCLWLLDKGYKITVYSARTRHEGGVNEIYNWLMKNDFPTAGMLVVRRKPSALLFIDDRGFRFEGDFSVVREFLENNPQPGSWAGPLT